MGSIPFEVEVKHVFMSMLTKEEFANFFRYYNNEPQQLQGVSELWAKVPSNLLNEDAEWIRTYREKPQESAVEGFLQLEVPYDSQHTNPSGDGWRECEGGWHTLGSGLYWSLALCGVSRVCAGGCLGCELHDRATCMVRVSLEWCV